MNLRSVEGSRRWIADSNKVEVGESTVGAGGLDDLAFSRLKDTVESCDYFKHLLIQYRHNRTILTYLIK